MPWSIKKDDRCPTDKPWGVVKDTDNELEGCHPSEAAAKKQQAALYANEDRSVTEDKRPPRDNLVRAVYPGVELHVNEDDPGGSPILTGHFARFNEWAEIDSVWEGRFMERIAPGAFRKTIEENRDRMRILFQHGQDPVVGDKPLAPIEELGEDEVGGFYAGRMLDTSYNRDIIPGLKADPPQYGSSFRFSVVKEDFDQKAKRSAHNPEGLPERTVKEARVYEMGPVTFPAYAGATAGVRSLTDIYALKRFVREPDKLADILESMRAEALPGAGSDHSAEGSREADPPPQVAVSTPPQDPSAGGSLSTPEKLTVTEPQKMPIEQRVARQSEIKSRLAAIDTEYAGESLPDEVRAEFDGLKTELATNEQIIKEVEERRAFLGSVDSPTPPKDTRQTPGVPEFNFRPTREDIYDTAAVRSRARTPADEVRMLRDNAKRATEIASFPGAKERSAAQTHVEWLLDNVVEYGHEKGTLARRILNTGAPVYDRAFGKFISGATLDNDEARALSLTAGAGGNAVTFDLDPTIMGTGARGVAPWRTISRVIPIVGDEWRGVTSGAITTAYDTEAAETTDNAPTLTQPAISTEKAQAFVPFSIEIDMDWTGMRGEMSQLLQESKDDLEATKFAVGTGTNEPFGVITGATTTVTATTGQTTDAEDFYRLTAALPERYQARASIVANRAIFNLVRQFVLTGQSNPWKDIDESTVTDGRAGILLGYPAYQSSAMAATTATNALFAIVGDFSRFVIVDRVGLNVEVLPHLLGANRRPTGQRGLYAFWRNGSKVINADAFRVLIGIA
jgi:HK97 family phage major capsid protein/HK97 family phage prohead protease